MNTNSRTSKRNSNRRGIAMIWMVISFMALLAFMALAIEAGRVYFTGHQLQNAADAASLAGARYVASEPNSLILGVARGVAQTYAGYNQAAKLAVQIPNLNTANSPTGDIVIGLFNPAEPDPSLRFIPMAPSDFLKRSPNAMKVVTRKDDDQNPKLPLTLGNIFGVDFPTIRKDAIAMIYNVKGAAVIALSEDEVGVYLHGNPEININNDGSVYSNTVGTSADFRGNPATDLAEFNLVGDYQVSGGFNPGAMDYAGLPTVVNTNVPPIIDPYKTLPEPTYSTTPDLGTISAPGTYEPGYYSGGIQVNSDTTVIHLNPGIYILDGTNKGGLDINGGVVTANGVMLHIVGGSVNVRGNTQLTLSPPASGTYAGISIFQEREYDVAATLNGGGGLNVTGVLYFPDNHLSISGNNDTIGTQLIADTVEIGGTGAINIPFMGSPQVAGHSYLVE